MTNPDSESASGTNVQAAVEAGLRSQQPAAVATVANAAYFPGLVALVNSLHLTGHTQVVTVLDLGLTQLQRDRLVPFCRMIPSDARAIAHPMLAKATVAAQIHEQGVVIMVDADVIITGSLAPIVADADRGRIAAVRDVDARYFPEWKELFALPEMPREQVYVNSGLVAYSNVHWPSLPSWWADACARVPPSATRSGGAPSSSPLWDSDQDALNAVLMSRIPKDALLPLDADAFPLDREGRLATRVVSADRLACVNKGASVVAIHDAGLHKRPWLPGSATGVRRDGYTRLLPRLWFADDLAVRIRPDEVTPWMADTPGGRAQLAALDLRNGLSTSVRRTRRAVYDRIKNRVRSPRAKGL